MMLCAIAHVDLDYQWILEHRGNQNNATDD